MAEFAAAQSNNVEAVRALAMAVSRMDKEHAAAQGVKP
jgi:hypothetical protein